MNLEKEKASKLPVPKIAEGRESLRKKGIPLRKTGEKTAAITMISGEYMSRKQCLCRNLGGVLKRMSRSGGGGGGFEGGTSDTKKQISIRTEPGTPTRSTIVSSKVKMGFRNWSLSFHYRAGGQGSLRGPETPEEDTVINATKEGPKKARGP